MRRGVPTLAFPEALVVFHLAAFPLFHPGSLTHDITSSHAGVSSLTHIPTAVDAKAEERAAA